MKNLFLTYLATCCLFYTNFAQTGWQEFETGSEDSFFELQCLGTDSIFIFGD